MQVRSLVVLTLAAALVSAGPLFAGGSAEQPKGGPAIKVALVVRSQDDAPLQRGALTAAKDLGNVEVIYREPQTPTAADQASIIDELVKEKVNAIIVAPAETGAAVDSLLVSVKKAVDARITVISLDQPLAAGGPLLEVSSASEEAVGRSLAKVMAGQIGDSGEIGILSASPDAAYQNAVIDGIKKELTAHANVRLDAILYGNNAPEKSGRETTAMLKAYPGMKGIIAPTTVGLEAAAKALEAASLGGKVQLTGLGVPADMQQYFDNGTCTQMLLGIPVDEGYAATYVAALLARGQIKGNRGENFKVGRMGTLAVDQQGRVPVPPPTLVTKDSIASFLETQ
jgi:rhamnose transport system substrate-binding protein